MVCIARIVKGVGSVLLVTFALLVMSACGPAAPASALSKAETNAISNNCSTIKQSLGQLQKVDSRTRTYLGTTYETIVNRFITPLNLRLVRNNHATLSEIQTDFSAEQEKFRTSYTDYMREMESLIGIDCQAEPEKFYDQLKIVRERRAKVRVAVEKLKELTGTQYQAVAKLRKELK